MVLIKFNEILNYFNKNNIKFDIIGETKDKYQIASIFDPIKNGFYYFVGNDIPINVIDSLILINKHSSINDKNCYIKIDFEPQEVYYKLLNFLYSEKTSGIIQKTAIIHPEVKIGKNVQIGHYSIINKCIIEDNVIIKNNCIIENNSIIGESSVIENHSNIGARGMAWVWETNNKHTNKIILPQLGGVHIGKNCILGSGSIVVRGSLNENTTIGNNTILAPGCRIGHGTTIGKFVHLANNVVTGGNVRIGDFSFIGSSVSFRPKVKIHNNTIIGTGSVVIKNTPEPNTTLIGIPAKKIISKGNPSGMPKPKK